MRPVGRAYILTHGFQHHLIHPSFCSELSSSCFLGKWIVTLTTRSLPVPRSAGIVNSSMVSPAATAEGAKEAQGAKSNRADPKEDQKKDAEIWTGYDETLKKAVALMEEFSLPAGLLQLEDVIELGFARATGYFWVIQKKKVEHTFKMIGKLVSYATEVSGFLEKHCIKKVSGVKAREFLIWVPVGDISVAEPTGKIHFKSIGGLTKIFPVEAFAAGQ